MVKKARPSWLVVKEAVDQLPPHFSAADVIRKVHETNPDVPSLDIKSAVVGCSPNHPAYRHYSLGHDLFYYKGCGRFRPLR